MNGEFPAGFCYVVMVEMFREMWEQWVVRWKQRMAWF